MQTVRTQKAPERMFLQIATIIAKVRAECSALPMCLPTDLATPSSRGSRRSAIRPSSHSSFLRHSTVSRAFAHRTVTHVTG